MDKCITWIVIKIMQMFGLFHSRLPSLKVAFTRRHVESAMANSWRMQTAIENHRVGRCERAQAWVQAIWCVTLNFIVFGSTGVYFWLLSESENTRDTFNNIGMTIWNTFFILLYLFYNIWFNLYHSKITTILHFITDRQYSCTRRQCKTLTFWLHVAYFILGFITSHNDINYYNTHDPQSVLKYRSSIVPLAILWYYIYFIDLAVIFWFRMVTFDLLSMYADYITRLESKELKHQNLMNESTAPASAGSTRNASDDDQLQVSGPPGKPLPTQELGSSRQTILEKWKQDLEFELVNLEGMAGEIREQVDHLMTLMGWPTLLRTIYDTISTSLSLYYVIDCVINQLPGLHNNLGLLVWRIFGFFLLATNTDEFNTEREKTSEKLRKMMYVSPALQSSTKAIKALKELEKPVPFRLASFTSLNRGMFASMCGSAVSYTVVAVQFRLSGIDGRSTNKG